MLCQQDAISQVYLEGSCVRVHVYMYVANVCTFALSKSLCRMFEKYNMTVATTELLGIDPDAKEVSRLVTMHNLLYCV